MSVVNFIPLTASDLTQADEAAVLAAIATSAWQDESLLQRWEEMWQHCWQRPAVVFASADQLMAALATALGWQAGDWLAADGLLEPPWRQACEALWLRLGWLDIDPTTGISPVVLPEVYDRKPRAWLRCHSFGQIAPLPPPSLCHATIEICSAIPTPIDGCGQADFQIIGCDGNQAITAGAACVLLGHDDALMQQIRCLRPAIANTLSCAMGLSRLRQWPLLARRRAELAQRYLESLRPYGLFELPLPTTEQPRVWLRFVLSWHDAADRLALQQFLSRAGISTDLPLWYRVPQHSHLPGMQQFLQRALALPLFASLAEQQQKRIINRIHRWINRRIRV
ncbi:MAG: DegT/DnrJ/EryC1/StrS family aminotransferase [Magnetococcales bacterium]|nr:DegT/DnrJ/EryC1/StrS family aminotransferase [Magnetococcales bacterium]